MIYRRECCYHNYRDTCFICYYNIEFKSTTMIRIGNHVYFDDDNIINRYGINIITNELLKRHKMRLYGRLISSNNNYIFKLKNLKI